MLNSVYCILSTWLVGDINMLFVFSFDIFQKGCMYLHVCFTCTTTSSHQPCCCLWLFPPLETLLKSQYADPCFFELRCVHFSSVWSAPPPPVSPNNMMHARHLYQFGPYGVDGNCSGKERSEVTGMCMSTLEHVLVLTVFQLAERAIIYWNGGNHAGRRITHRLITLIAGGCE